MRYKNGWRVLIGALCCTVALQPGYAQQREGQVGLKIVVVEGANAKNTTQEIPLRPLTVRVEAINNQPVPNATVGFAAPEAGPSGEFANDSHTFSATTNEDGLATARGYHPNAITGAYTIKVRAVWRGETATVEIPQSNVAPGHGGLGKRIAIIAIAGAAAGAVIAARGHGSSSNSNAPTITFGGGAVGAPR